VEAAAAPACNPLRHAGELIRWRIAQRCHHGGIELGTRAEVDAAAEINAAAEVDASAQIDPAAEIDAPTEVDPSAEIDAAAEVNAAAEIDAAGKSRHVRPATDLVQSKAGPVVRALKRLRASADAVQETVEVHILGRGRTLRNAVRVPVDRSQGARCVDKRHWQLQQIATASRSNGEPSQCTPRRGNQRGPETAPTSGANHAMRYEARTRHRSGPFHRTGRRLPE
jgi:hypothetical protein